MIRNTYFESTEKDKNILFLSISVCVNLFFFVVNIIIVWLLFIFLNVISFNYMVEQGYLTKK